MVLILTWTAILLLMPGMQVVTFYLECPSDVAVEKLMAGPPENGPLVSWPKAMLSMIGRDRLSTASLFLMALWPLSLSVPAEWNASPGNLVAPKNRVVCTRLP